METKDLGKNIFIGVFFIVGLFLVSLYNGLALSILWGWFIVPVTGFTYLGYWQAAGLSLTVSFIRLKLKTHEEAGDKVDHWNIGLQALIAAPIFLLIGWIFKILAGL